MLPLIALAVAERLRDRGCDVCICIDDLAKHSKAYRQCSLLLNKIPSRDAYPADIFNVQSSLLFKFIKGKLALERVRCSKVTLEESDVG